MKEPEQNKIIEKALYLLAERCLRLKTQCYWAGTSSIAMEELGHRISFDLDFHTRKALLDVRPILAEIQKAFPGNVEMIQTPDQFGSSFRCILVLPEGERITLEVLSNYEDVPDTDLVKSSIAPDIYRVSLSRYLADKIQCISERVEARDFVDISAVIKKYPDMKERLIDLLAAQDALLMTERLLSWTDKAIEEDLKSYIDVKVSDALETRKLLLELLRQLVREGK
jgi:hypothetical protein